ncbi:MAG: DUF3144 domain-containing protein [Alphaproteobacteria bacterium]
MTSDDTRHSPGTTIANEIISMANTSLEGGQSVEAIAEGLRHAAANFSAYAFFRSQQFPKDPNDTVENFVTMFEHYLGRHKPQDTAGQGLAQTIAKAQDEL